ncbi:MaoC family dehydratase [Segnochrobactraceae bacterium EtOH-i3]
MSFFEDLVVGTARELGEETFTADAIKTYARAYDPQPFHLDEEAGRRSHFGALCASGLQVLAVSMKLMIATQDRLEAEERARGKAVPPRGPSPGVETVRWLKPVFAGDTLRFRTTLADKRASASRPEWGITTWHMEAFNQKGEQVLSYRGNVFVRRRAQAAA